MNRINVVASLIRVLAVVSLVSLAKAGTITTSTGSSVQSSWSGGSASSSSGAGSYLDAVITTVGTSMSSATAGSLYFESFSANANQTNQIYEGSTASASTIFRVGVTANGQTTLGTFNNANSGVNQDLFYLTGNAGLLFRNTQGSSNTFPLNIALGSSGNFNVSAGSLLSIASTITTVSTITDGPAVVTVTGNGTTTLAGNNSGISVAGVSGGILNANSAGALGSGANFAVGSVAGGLGTLTLAAVPTTPKTFTINGGGVLNITSVSDSTDTIINSGKLNINAGSTLTTITAPGAGAILLNGTSGNTATWNQNYNKNGSASASGINIGALTFTGYGNLSLGSGAMATTSASSNAITSSGALTFSGGNNTITLTGTALGTGTYDLIGGTSIIGASGNVSLIGAGAGGVTTAYGSTSTVGRATYQFTSSGNILQLIVGGGAANLVWTGSTSTAWSTAAVNNWSKSGTPDQFYTGDNVTFNNATLANASPVVDSGGVTSGSMTVNATNGTITVTGGAITAGGAFNKSGAGVLALNNSASAYNSGFNVAEGSVTAVNAITIGSGVNVSGGTMTLSGGGTIGGGITMTGGTATLGNIATITGGLAITNANLNLNAANTLSGGISIGSGGVVTSGAAGSLGINNTLADGGTLALGANSETVGAVTMTGGSITGTTAVLSPASITASSGANTISAIIGGTGGITLSGGTLALNGANTFSGLINVTGGTLQAGSSTALGATGSAITVAGGAGVAAVDLNGQSIGAKQLNISGGTSTTGALKNSSSSAASYAGKIVSTGGATYVDQGTGGMTLSGTIQSGTTSSKGNMTAIGSGTLSITGTAAVSSLAYLFSLNGTILLDNPTVLSGAISSVTAVASWGDANNSSSDNSILQLGSAGNYYMSNLQIGGNNAVIGPVSQGSQASVTFNSLTPPSPSGATKVIAANSPNVTVNLGASSGSASLLWASTANRTLSLDGSGTIVLNANVTESGGFSAQISHTNVGLLTLAGTESGISGGLNVGGGKVSFGALANMPTGPITLGNSNSSSETLLYTGAALTLNNAITLNGSGTGYNSATISNNGTGLLTLTTMGGPSVSGGFNTLTLSGTGNGVLSGNIVNGSATEIVGTATFAGSTLLQVSGNNYSVGSVVTGAGIAPGTVVSAMGGGAITLSSPTIADISSGSSVTVAGTNSVSKAGNDTWTLSGINTYSGPTTIIAGILNVTGSIANSPTIVAGGGTLSGGGTLGDVTVQSLGSLNPEAVSASRTVMTMASLNLNSGSTTTLDIENINQAAGTGYDKIVINGGALAYNGTLNITSTSTLAQLFGGAAQSVVLFSGMSTPTGDLTAVEFNAGATWTETSTSSGVFTYTDGVNTYSFTDATGTLAATAVPEPGTCAMVGLGLSALAVTIIRRRRND